MLHLRCRPVMSAVIGCLGRGGSKSVAGGGMFRLAGVILAQFITVKYLAYCDMAYLCS